MCMYFALFYFTRRLGVTRTRADCDASRVITARFFWLYFGNFRHESLNFPAHLLIASHFTRETRRSREPSRSPAMHTCFHVRASFRTAAVPQSYRSICAYRCVPARYPRKGGNEAGGERGGGERGNERDGEVVAQSMCCTGGSWKLK